MQIKSSCATKTSKSKKKLDFELDTDTTSAKMPVVSNDQSMNSDNSK